MKKALSLIIAIVMMLNFAAFAATTPSAGSGGSGLGNTTQSGSVINGVQQYEDQYLYPGLDMTVRESGGTYAHGPLTINASSATVDYNVTLDKGIVYSTFVDWYERISKFIDFFVNNSGLTDQTALDTLKARYHAEFEALVVTGEFVIDITYPNSLIIPDSFLKGGNMEGFDQGSKDIYYEVGTRKLTKGSTTNNLKITVDVRDEVHGGKLTAGALYAKHHEYLDDMHLTAEGVKIPAPGTYTVTGKMSGHTNIEGLFNGVTKKLVIYYTGKMIEAGKETNASSPSVVSTTVILSDGGSTSTPSGNTGVTLAPILKFNVDGNTTLVPSVTGKTVVKFEDLPKPTKAGYTFDGWYYDSGLKNKVNSDVVVDRNITLYGHFKSETLETEDHFAYIVGYPDGEVKPQNNITREEVATIFYRLLREDKRAEVTTTKNDFSDVDASRWSNKAISTLANGGYINGYADGTFGPAKPITRAEFATMATRYAVLAGDKNFNFSDVVNHWAKDYINKAAAAGWVNGYSDGTFGPQKHITRAEVMTIINRMLVRYVDADGVHADAKLWSDMNGSEWYYWTVIEATNAHDYERREDGKLEKWTAITENKIIKEFDEKEAPEA